MEGWRTSAIMPIARLLKEVGTGVGDQIEIISGPFKGRLTHVDAFRARRLFDLEQTKGLRLYWAISRRMALNR